MTAAAPMTDMRRAILLRLIAAARCGEELSGIRAGLRRSGEITDSEILRALEARAESFRLMPRPFGRPSRPF